MRELPPQDDLIKPRDHAPIIVVPPHVWHCLICQPEGPTGAATSVQWLGPETSGPHGRCTDCGQKYSLASENWMKLRDGMPREAAPARMRHCPHCEPRAEAGARPTVAWRGSAGRCARCGQSYLAAEAPPERRAA
ncbi:MAG: hypothetical protein R3C39_00435 [Dehalococcoidia bacterium]